MRRITSCLIALALIWAGVITAPDASAEEPDPVSAATNHLYSCLQTAHSVSVLFVLDKSGSLNLPDKDPNGLRYDGLATALTGLSSIQRSDGQRIDIEAAIAGFSDSYLSANTVSPWQRINGDDSDQVIAGMVDSARKNLTPHGGTDFQQALEGGYSDFGIGSRVADCRIMFWFTDGEFSTAKGKDLIDDGPELAGPLIEQARQEICAPGTGVIDQLRSNGVVVLGIQLGPAAADLKRMSIGILADQTCGTWPIPEGWAPGGYLQVDDAANLTSVFAQMNDLATGCTPTGEVGNQIDPGIRRMVVRIPRSQVVTPVPEREQATLTAPDGSALSFSVPGTQDVQGYHVESTHDAGFIGARVTIPAGAPSGPWQIVEPSDHGAATYCVWSDVSLSADPNQPQLTAGSSGEIRAIATLPDGSPADLGLYQDVTINATVTNASGSTQPVTAHVEGNTIIASVTPSELDPRLDIDFTAQLVTASGLQLAPVTASWSVPVHSDSFPSITPADRLDLGTIERTDTGTGSLTVTGAKLGTSTVCLAPSDEFSSPVDGESNRIALAEGCIELQPGERREVEVSFTPSKDGVGSGRSGIEVTLTSAAVDGQEPSTSTFTLPVQWYQNIPVNVATFSFMLVGLLVICVLAVAGAVWLAMYLTTTFHTTGLRYAIEDVEIGSFGVRPLIRAGNLPVAQPGRRIPTTAPPTETAATEALIKNVSAAPPVNKRRIRLSGSKAELLAIAPLLPGIAPRFIARVPEGQLVASNSSQTTFKEGTEVPVPPNLSLLILVTARIKDVKNSRDGGPVRATLHVFTTIPTKQTDGAAQMSNIRAAIDRMGWLGVVNEWQKHHRQVDSSPNTSETPTRTTRRRSH